MNDLFLLYLSLSLSGSLLVLVLAALKSLTRRFGRTWQYYIWILVLLRLLIPLSPETNLVGSLFQQAAIHLAAGDIAVDDTAVGSVADGSAADGSIADGSIADGSAQGDAASIALVSLPEASDSHGTMQPTMQPTLRRRRSLESLVVSVGGSLWLAVATALLMRKLFGYRQFTSAVRKESVIVAEGRWTELMGETRESLGISRKIPVCTNPFVRAPMLLGMLRPAVVLPEGLVESPELPYIFQHELTHYRRGDLLYKWLVEVVVCLHWFNPLVYWMRREIGRDCELSCDEAVVSRMDDGERYAYGEMLLNCVAVGTPVVSSIPALSLSEDGALLERRLGEIARYRRVTRPAALVAAVVTVVLLGAAIFAGAHLTGKSSISPGPLVPPAPASPEVPVSTGVTGEERGLSSVTYESVVLHRPGEGDGRFSYIHDIRKNDTEKMIVATERGMLAFDQEGNPLVVDWNSMDTSAKPSCYFLCDWDSTEILPGQTDDVEGGWTLNILGRDDSVDHMAYVLYCDKKITFSDGTVWENPEYGEWLDSYGEKRVDVELLKNYYPHVQIVQ